MTPDQQRITIASFCNWSCPNCSQPAALCTGCDFQDYPARCVPDYPNDLNAMHEAEKRLSDKQFRNYRECLMNDCLQKHTSPWVAAAAQRAEAFCRVI